jgi:transcriptional repressor NrdR
MNCPSCGENENKVIDSRLTEGGRAIRRRRVCQACGRRFTTKERLEDELRISVIKSGGQRVPYNRDNVLRGVAKACTKLDLTDQHYQELTDRVEGLIFANHDREVTTEAIGTYVGTELRKLHPVAYVRFMSVHRKYASVDEFIEEITDVRERVAHETPTQQTLFDSQ